MIDLFEPNFSRKVQLAELASSGIAVLLYGDDIEEERASTIMSEVVGHSSVVASKVELIDDAICHVDGYGVPINLFEESDLRAFVASLEGRIAIDLTSLEHRVWAPLVKVLVSEGSDFLALYAEPDDYRRSDELPGAVYDLSLGRGIEPLPGFARVARRRDDEGFFVPLLGFEGARLGHIFDQEEVEASRSYPIVGSPGFRIEYPTYTFIANRDTLEVAHMDRRVQLARASCPFEAYRAIARVHGRIGGKHLRVAPIGTKPHALGAVLYAIRNPAMTELVYDHPERSRGRTRGSRGVYVYEVSGFLAEMDSSSAS